MIDDSLISNRNWEWKITTPIEIDKVIILTPLDKRRWQGEMSLKIISNNKDTFMTNCHLYSLCRRRPWSGNKLYEWVYYYDYYNCMYQSESSKEVLSPLFGTRNLYSGNSQWWRSKGERKKKKKFINHQKKGLLKNM